MLSRSPVKSSRASPSSGIKPDWDGLKIDPCIPHTWDGYQVSRRFRGCLYEIQIRNPEHVCRGVKKMTVGLGPSAHSSSSASNKFT